MNWVLRTIQSMLGKVFTSGDLTIRKRRASTEAMRRGLGRAGIFETASTEIKEPLRKRRWRTLSPREVYDIDDSGYSLGAFL